MRQRIKVRNPALTITHTCELKYVHSQRKHEETSSYVAFYWESVSRHTFSYITRLNLEFICRFLIIDFFVVGCNTNYRITFFFFLKKTADNTLAKVFIVLYIGSCYRTSHLITALQFPRYRYSIRFQTIILFHSLGFQIKEVSSTVQINQLSHFRNQNMVLNELGNQLSHSNSIIKWRCRDHLICRRSISNLNQSHLNNSDFMGPRSTVCN